MQVVPRDADTGYYSCHLWVPKSKVNVNTLKAALTFPMKVGRSGAGLELNYFAWKEAPNHLLIPRHLFDLEHMRQQFPIVDVRPQKYPVSGIKSRIVLDAKNPKLTLQRDAAAAMLNNHGGLIQLSCGKGKAQPVSTMIPTIVGTREMGSLRVGDYVYGSNGTPIRVDSVHPQGVRDVYRVMFEDGTSTRCCLEHLWGIYNSDKEGEKPKVEGTDEIRRRITHGFPVFVPTPVSSPGLRREFSYRRKKARLQVVSVTPDGSEDCVCIQVNAPDRLYVTSNFVMTHNTVIALDVIATLNVPALVLVDTVQLAEQWAKEVREFLEVPGGIGRLYGGKREWKKNLVIGTYETVASITEDVPPGFKSHFGVLVADEAHHTGARTYMPCIDLLPCRRYGLSATPYRADGMMPAYLASLGPILYKNLMPDWTPKAVFLRTNIGVDLDNPEDRAQVLDASQELHFGMVCSFLGKKPERLNLIIDEVRKAIDVGRHILVLSYSITELVNLYCTYSGLKERLSDIPQPTAKELGLAGTPNELSEKRYKQLEGQRGQLFQRIRECTNPLMKKQYEVALESIRERLVNHDTAIAIQREYEKRQVDFIKRVVSRNTDAGLLIRRVPVDVRMKMLEEKKVIFAVMKYGREALNQPLIDSVLICEPAAQKGGIWQMMGRALRDRPNKKQPIVMFLEDKIGQNIGMCKKIKKYMGENPAEEGGPVPYFEFDYREKLNLWRELT